MGTLQEVIDVAMYLASVELCATEDCFLHIHDIIAEPKLKQHLELLFPLVTLPSQSKSVYPCRSNSTFSYLSPRLKVPCKIS